MNFCFKSTFLFLHNRIFWFVNKGPVKLISYLKTHQNNSFLIYTDFVLYCYIKSDFLVYSCPPEILACKRNGFITVKLRYRVWISCWESGVCVGHSRGFYYSSRFFLILKFIPTLLFISQPLLLIFIISHSLILFRLIFRKIARRLANDYRQFMLQIGRAMICTISGECSKII